LASKILPAECLESSVRKLDQQAKPTEAQASQALDSALKQIGQTSDSPGELQALAEALQALAPRS
jgi:hypothetical protein